MPNDKLTREITFRGAYDWGRKYGAHGVDLCFLVKGPLGVVVLEAFTDWKLNQNHQHTPGILQFTALVVHRRDGKGASGKDSCDFLGGAPCTVDIWFNQALKYQSGFLHGGSEWLFARLEEFYHHHFHDGPAPDLTPIPRPYPEDAHNA